MKNENFKAVHKFRKAAFQTMTLDYPIWSNTCTVQKKGSK
jgi:hypothetical protein